MSTLTTDIVSGITVLEECPVGITVTYSGDDILKILQSACLKNDYVVEFKCFYV